MIPLLFGSIITFGIIIERLLNFRPKAMINTDTVNAVVAKVSNNDSEGALQVVAGQNTLLETRCGQPINWWFRRYG